MRRREASGRLAGGTHGQTHIVGKRYRSDLSCQGIPVGSREFMKRMESKEELTFEESEESSDDDTWHRISTLEQ